MQDAPLTLRARADGRRGHALHPLHVRHDREAEGHRAHDRRLPRRHLRDDEAGLRSQRRRRLLVHGRHRLGDRPQLRRLRPARERRDGADVRGRARLAGEGSLLVDRSSSYGVTIFYTAPTAIRAFMRWGTEWPAQARSVVAAAARIGRRADQPRGVDVVPRVHRRRALPGRRHVVADRDRRDHDHAAARRHDARSRDRRRRPFPGIAAEIRNERGDNGRGRRRPARADAAVAVDAARHLRRSRALRAAVLEQVGQPASTSPATARSATTTATSGCSAASTTC